MVGERTDLRHFSGSLVLIGAGRMGGALLEGWLDAGMPGAAVAVFEPSPSPQLTAAASRGVRLNPILDAGARIDAVVVAVKPQTADLALAPVAPLVGRSAVVVSIMAGRTLAYLSRTFGGANAFVRAMPNTPAAIGRGITVAVPLNVTAAQRDLAQALLAATGAVQWVDDEGLMDAVTAVSGSGPAYVFLLVEALAQAGVAAGLPPKLADVLARQTVAGSGELLQRSELSASTLRDNVTSPGGTTAAALEVLMAADGLAPLLRRAVAAATARSRKLAD